jgi:hypothetical protein
LLQHNDFAQRCAPRSLTAGRLSAISPASGLGHDRGAVLLSSWGEVERGGDHLAALAADEQVEHLALG